MRVDVSGRLFSFPTLCVCCCGQPDAQQRISASRTRGRRVVRTTTQYWDVPCCSRCLAHQQLWAQGNTGLAVMLGVGVVLWAFAHGIAGMVLFVLALAGGIAMRVRAVRRARLACASTCAGPLIAARFVGWDGSFHSFEFDSRTYAARFMAANSGKLVNVTPEGRQLVDWAFDQRRGELEQRHTHLLAEHQAASQQVVDAREEEAYARWIGRIESARGPASRQAEKEAALRSITRSDLRERVVIEAVGIEVRAALEKVDALKSPAAKLRTLKAALQAVRAEPIPAEIQANQTAPLEEAIAEIEGQA